MTTINSYIIELFKWKPETYIYEKADDCVMTLNQKTGDFKIISADNNVPYVGLNIIEDNFHIISRERQNIASLNNISNNISEDLKIDYEMKFKNHRFGIRFDARSAASEANFYDAYMCLKHICKFSERYPSGNISIEGTKTESGYNGYCIEYYDMIHSPVKYMGEFEDGEYDGEGDFFSSDGLIRLNCKNICAGKPNGIGRLIVGRNKIIHTIDMKKFSSLDASHEEYTNNIYKQIEPKYDELLVLLGFEAMTVESQTMYLFREIQKIKTMMKDQKQSKTFFNLF
jgi:hypothetical protein